MTEHNVQNAVHTLLNEVVARKEEINDQKREHLSTIDALMRQVIEISDGIERIQVALPIVAPSLQAVIAQVHELLADQGLISFRPAVGSEVDGRTSEVLATVSNPGLRPGTVTSVVRSGYRGEDRLIRRAGVEIVREQP